MNQNKIAVISGGAGYVGSEVGRELSKQGFRIALLYRTTDEKTLGEILSSFSGEGHKAYKCELANEGEVKEVIARINSEMGRIYACIHTAGVIPKPRQLHLSTLLDLEEQFQLNVYGSFNFLSACALYLKEYKEGVIVGITTAGVATSNNTKARGAYSVVKFALQGMLVALKEELRHFNIKIYSVAPGFMEGGMNSTIPHAFAEMVKHSSPTKTLTNATEVAKKIAYLCSDDPGVPNDLTILMAPETDVVPHAV
jgi:acetoacetyl-CoA reductase